MNNKIKVLAGITVLGSTALISNAFATPQIFTGNVVPDGPYGNVQVQITVDNGQIIAINTPVQPTGQSASYASYAIPSLVTEALTAQSANINGVSGASFLSTAWKSSLASAIANAGSAIGVQVTPAPTTSPTPSVNLNGNTVCATASPTPVSTTTSTTQVAPTPTVSQTPSNTPTPTPSLTRTPTPTPTNREVEPTPNPTKIISQEAEPLGGDNLRVTTVLAGANDTVITIIKTITQNQVVTCTTTNTVTNTITVPTPGPTVYIPGPTVTVTAHPIPVDSPVVVGGIPSHPIIVKTPKPTVKPKPKSNPYKIDVITCKSGNSIKIIAKHNPSCPTGYKKVK